MLAGIITDGDLRRMLQKQSSFENIVASDIMSPNPRIVAPDTLVADALNLMRENNITQLLVVEDGIYMGVLHLHDILHEGII
jgi:arabinose-5-phosphate isomerase